MPNQSAALRALAAEISDLKRRVRSNSSTGQLGNSSFEDGAIRGYSGESQVMQIGRQWDGTYTAAVTSGPIPPTPSAPIVTDGTEGISVRWDGGFAGGLLGAPMDYLRVDIYISTTDGFTPDFSNRFGSIIPPTGGEVAFALAAGTYYIKLVCWTQAGVPSAASAQSDGDAWPVAAGTDGFPPSSSPAAEVVGGYEALSVRWTPITNADPVRYNIYVGTSAGFTKDATTLAGSSTGSQFTVRLLPGDPPTDPNDPDLRKLQYDTDYYVSVQAEDDDGAATPGAEDVAQIFKIQGEAIGYQTIIGDNILGNTIGADKLSATLVLATEVWAGGTTGQRVGLTPNGFQGYKSDGSLMLNFPTDPTQSTLIDSDVIARSLTAVGAMVMRSNNNSIEKDSVLKLRNGVSSPVAVPVMDVAWGQDTVQFSTEALSSAQKTGALGTFDFKANEASCIEYKTVGVDYWVVHQVRPGGTRAWFFDYNGSNRQIGAEWFHDYVDWEIWSVVEITTSSAPKNGVYRMARWIPSGAAQQYYLWSPAGLNKYSRQNGVAPPVIGSNGTDVYVAEVINTDDLLIRYFVPNGDGNNLAAPTSTFQSTTGYTATRPLSVVTYDANGFDIGAARYLTAERGFTANNKLVYTSGSAIYPGGSGGSWVSSTKDAESFEVAHTNPRAVAYDGSSFWTLGGDGVMYQHTSMHWDPSVRSSTIWAQYTFWDGDAAGTGTHETTPGPAKSFYQKRRSAVQFFVPPIPGAGGVDEAKEVSLYVGIGAMQPANSAMWWQVDKDTTIWLEDFETTGTSNPPTVNSFPNTNPGKIQSDDGEMVISGDGTITSRLFRTTASGKRIEIDSADDTGQLTFFSGFASETAPANIQVATNAFSGYLNVAAPATTATPDPPSILLASANDLNLAQLNIFSPKNLLLQAGSAITLEGTQLYFNDYPAMVGGPTWIGYLSSAPSPPAASTLTTLTGWTSLESNGITVSSGVFTVPEAGLYRIAGQLWWAAAAGSNGLRLTQAVKTSGTATTISSVTLNPPTSGAPAIAQFSKLFRLAAGDTVIVRFQHTDSGTPANRVPTATSQDISFLQITRERL